MAGEQNEMPKVFACRDIGMDCVWKTRAGTVGEILLVIGEHVAVAHKITDAPSELLVQVRKAIRDET